MVRSCAEPLALPSRSPVCSSLSGPPRLSSAPQPGAQSATESSPSSGRLKCLETGCGGSPHPIAPPHRVAHRFPGSLAESDGIPPPPPPPPLPCISSACFSVVTASVRVFKPPFLLLPPSKRHPGGKSSFPKLRWSKAGRKGRLREKGNMGQRQREGGGGGWWGGVGSSRRAPCGRLMDSLSLPPTLAKH